MGRIAVLGAAVFAALIVGGAWFYATMGTTPVRGGWGIDACLTTHVNGEARSAYLERLAESGVGWLRERQPKPSMKSLRRAGYRIVAFTNLSGLKAKNPGNQLHEDLRTVFVAARAAQRRTGITIDAWEMVGEPDIGYCTDLPDRVAAYQKALYLGLKAGARDRKTEDGRRRTDSKGLIADDSRQTSDVRQQLTPLVIMGALGMPPGPWLERAAANGLLEYTDAYNFHYYGHAKDMTGVVDAHRAAISALVEKDKALTFGFGAESGRTADDGWPMGEGMPARQTQGTSGAALPMWITEAGLAAVNAEDFLNPKGRKLQADFSISTAKQALATEDVAVFMPFILVHDKDPYAMTLSADKPLPAWDAYAKFSRENPWPKRQLSREPHEVNPVVLQWLPDNNTCVPYKVSGTYRFKGDEPIQGELRIYNFGDYAVEGWIKSEDSKNASVAFHGLNPLLQPITVPAMGMKVFPVTFSRNVPGYFREVWAADFVEETGRRSPVNFGLEAWARLEDFTEEPLSLHPLPNGNIQFPQNEPYLRGMQVGVWSLMNGVRAEQTSDRENGDGRLQYRFWIEKETVAPPAPTMAVASTEGLPAAGFLRLKLDKPMTKERKIRVMLVDDRGQRYTIWENFGADYYGSRSDIWMNLEDFHPGFWGPLSTDYRFRPERIKEVHLRFYFDRTDDPIQVRLSMLVAQKVGEAPAARSESQAVAQ